MRKAIRCICLVLVLCLFFGIAGTVTASYSSVDGQLVVGDYNFKIDDTAALQALFCMDARGFIKALAFESAWTQSLAISHLLNSEDPYAFSAVSYILRYMNQNSGKLLLTQSEKNLLAAISFQRELWYGFEYTKYNDIAQLLENARYPISADEYTNPLGLCLRDDSYDFIVALSAMDAKGQQTILAQLAMLNGTVRSIPVVSMLNALLPQQTEPASTDPESDSPGPLEPGWVFTQEQTELINAILESLKDTPPIVEPQEPIQDEKTQWRADKIVPRRNFDSMLNQIIDNNGSDEYLIPIFLETASFIDALARVENADSRERIISFVLYIKDARELRSLLYNIQSRLTYSPPNEESKEVAAQLKYAILCDSYHGFESVPDFSQYFSQPEDQTGSETENAVFQFGISVCWYPKEFLAAYVVATDTSQDAINLKLKTQLDSAVRQAMVDTLYDLQSDETLSDTELEALQAVLAYQAKAPGSMYPYGIDPDTPPTTEPTEITEATETTEVTDSTEMTDPTQGTSEDTPSDGNHSTRLLRTMILCVAAFAVGVPIGICYVNRKERRTKAETHTAPPAPDEEDILW